MEVQGYIEPIADPSLHILALPSSDYAALSHEGPGMLMPLVQRFGELLDSNLERLGTKSPRILDVASGSGEPACTFAAANKSAKVTATDFAPGMVEMSKQRAAAKGLENMSFAVADATNLEDFADGSFDVVSCASSLPMFPDPAAALREFRRVLRPGGLLLVSVWALPPRTDFVRTFLGARAKLFPDVPEASHTLKLKVGDPVELEKGVQEAGFGSIQLSNFNLVFDLRSDIMKSAFMKQPMVNGLCQQLAGQGVADPLAAFTAALEDSAKVEGYWSEEGMLFPTNMAIVCEAWAS